MTDDTPTTDRNAQLRHPPATTSRRSVLRAASILPAAGLPSISTATDAKPLAAEPPLVDAAALPDAFKPYEPDRPVPMVRELTSLDDRFSAADHHSRVFVDDANTDEPRYAISTGIVDLPDPDAVAPVRTVLVDWFHDLMAGYDTHSRTHWSVDRTPSIDTRVIRVSGDITIPPDHPVDIPWADPGPIKYSEQWALAATDDRAVITLVFGDREGPWQPRALFAQISRYVRRRLTA